MPSDEYRRTIRRIGATVATLLALLSLHVHALYDENWGRGVAPDFLAVGFPWVVVLVSLAYLTLSLVRGIGKRIEKPEAASPEHSEGTAND